MKYRIKAYHYTKKSIYVPQFKFLWFWLDIGVTGFSSYGGPLEFTSKIKAQKFLDDYIESRNPKIEYIPHEI